MADVGNLQEESLKRKEKLRALRERHRIKDDKLDGSHDDTSHEALPKPVFRSYKPKDESLQESMMPHIKPHDVTEKVEDQLALGKDDKTVEEIEITNLAPRKPDWDLKRDIASKLEKLERRTQRAIAELIRERLKGEDLVTMVNANAELHSRAEED